MKPTSSTISLACILAIAFAHEFAAAAACADEPVANATYGEVVIPFIRAHCADCHSADEPEAGLSLVQWSSPVAAKDDRATWERVRRALTRREMPPADQEQPPSDQLKAVVNWIDREVLGIDCSKPRAGRVTIRRLNRQEYQNTIRDLLGVEVSVDRFPVDPSGHGFDNLGDVLSMPPVLVERYLEAAEAALAEAIVAPDDLRGQNRRLPLDQLELGYNAKAQGNGAVSLTSVEEDDIVAELHVPLEADYVMRVSASGQQRKDRPVELTFLVGESAIETLKIAPDESRVYEAKMRVPRGRQKFRVSMRRIKDGLTSEEAAEWKKGPTQEGSITVDWFEIDGPSSPDLTTLPPSHLRMFAPAEGKLKRDEAIPQIMREFATRAYRRPVSDDDANRLAQFASSTIQRSESFEAGIRSALAAVLVSPQFLYRTELIGSGGSQEQETKEAAVSPRVVLLDDYALASRLSYFLWSSMPDDELFEHAARGTLRQNLAAQVQRMLADRKSQALVSNFAGQWLELRNLAEITPDPRLFRRFDAELREAMQRETELLFEHIVREDLPITELISAEYTFVNDRLARHYRLEGVDGKEFRKVNLTGTNRRGVLTHASVLTLTSNPTRTSPVKRGKWVLENLLGAPPPPPPPNVPELDKAGQVDESLSLRQRLEQHRASPTCASCHRRMDSIGFALEHFDAIGRWRDADGEAAIDARGELFAGPGFDGADDLAQLLAGPERERFLRCTSEKMLTFALGRGLEYFDTCTVDTIVERVASDNARFSSLVLAIVESVPFHYVELPPDQK